MTMKISILPAKEEKQFTCSSCRKLIPSPFCAIEGAPAILGCSPNPSIEQDKFLDFQIYVCPFCGLIQTDAILDSESYEIVHSHAVGGVWAEHRDKLLEFISGSLRNRLGRLESALEIGPSVNPILKKLPQKVSYIQYVDLMEKAPFELTPNAYYEKQPFPSAQLKGEFDLIVASHVLEHSESIYGFMKAIKRHLKLNGVAILSIPNFHDWLTKRYWNAITSEHLNYPFVEHIRDLCVRLASNLRILRRIPSLCKFRTRLKGMSQANLFRGAPKKMPGKFSKTGLLKSIRKSTGTREPLVTLRRRLS